MTRYPITPCPAPRMNVRSRFNPKHAGAIARYHAFKDECRLRGVVIPERAFIRFEIPIPKSKLRQRAPHHPHQQRPDLDNYIKALLDSVLDEDSHVWEIKAQKVWAYEGAILISELE